MCVNSPNFLSWARGANQCSQGLTAFLVQRYIHGLHTPLDFTKLIHVLSFLALRVWRRAFKYLTPRFYAESFSSEQSQYVPNWAYRKFRSWMTTFFPNP